MCCKLNIRWIICLITINGMLYYSILTDRLYVIVVKFMLLKLYIMYRYTNGLCGRHPFSKKVDHSRYPDISWSVYDEGMGHRKFLLACRCWLSKYISRLT